MNLHMQSNIATTYNALLVCDIIHRISPFHWKRRKRRYVYTQKLKICNPTLPTYIHIQLSSPVYIHNGSVAVTANSRHPRALSSWKTTRLSKLRWANDGLVQYRRLGRPKPLSTHESVLKLPVNFAKHKHI